MKNLKYLVAYLIPISCWVGLHFGGFWSLSTLYLAFILLPFLELFIFKNTKNYSKIEEESRTKIIFFDILLWLNIPILYGLLWMFFHKIEQNALSDFEILASILCVGTVAGTCGINVGHELGHRQNKAEQFLAKLLLLPELYMHFYIEHNLGHHKNVATDLDPASAKLGENVYFFWWRSIKNGWLNAWQLESQLLKKNNYSFFSIKNEMLIFQIVQICYLAAIAYFFSIKIMFCAIGIAVMGVTLLETINYIEHYGLRRKMLSNGRYENVLPSHSWNSNHELGRIFLYELTRHSDHHYKSTRKYQILRHFDDSPQLPFGYPGSLLIALLPPLWFKVMNKRVPQ